MRYAIFILLSFHRISYHINMRIWQIQGKVVPVRYSVRKKLVNKEFKQARWRGQLDVLCGNARQTYIAIELLPSIAAKL